MEDQIKIKQLISFVEDFDTEDPLWADMPKSFPSANPDVLPVDLLPKFLTIKALFELEFGRDLQLEITAKPHGGYRNLEAFKMAEIVYDFTMEFLKTYKSNKTYMTYITYKTCEQIEGAARSGKQNTCPLSLCSDTGRRVAEGSQRASVSPETELQLIDVARASFEELLQDFQDFLKNNHFTHWEKDDQKVLKIRKLAYRTDKTYLTYKSYMTHPESAANCAICLISQTNYLLDQLLRALKRRFY